MSRFTLSSVLQDLAFAVRTARREPSTFLLSVAILGFGIGAVVAIFAAVDAALLAPLPYEDPDELVVVWQDHSAVEGPRDEWVSADNFFVWRDRQTVFDGVMLVGGVASTLQDGSAEVLGGAAISHNGLEVLGVDPIRGRGFLPEEDVANGPAVALIGYDLWTRRFDASEDIVGSKITLSGVPTTVVGVMPPGFEVPFAGGRDLFQPVGVDSSNSCGHGCVTFRALARLGDGVALDRAQAQMSSLAVALEEIPANRGVGVFLEPLPERLTASYRGGLWLLFGAVSAVLLLACANVANLTLARATGREHELSVRLALGAGRWRVVRQLITESLVLGVASAALGLLLAQAGARAIRALAPSGLEALETLSIDLRAVVAVAILGLVVAVLAGALPVLRVTLDSLRVRGDADRGSSRLRGGLVVAEVALATLLLVAGGLLARSFAQLLDVDPGFRPDGVLSQQLFLPPSDYEDDDDLRSFVARVVESVEALPGAVSAGVVNSLPLSGNDADSGFLIEGRPEPAPGERVPIAWMRIVSADYADTAGLRLVSGRLLDDTDRSDAPGAVLANEAAVRRYWPEGDALGGSVRFRLSGPPWQIVGIVEDTRQFGLTEPDRPALYRTYEQSPGRFMSLVVRSDSDPEALAPAVRSVIEELDPMLGVTGVATLRSIVDSSMAVPRLLRTVLLGFAASALLLAALGIYGVMAYSVRRRTAEVGLRMALGAAPGNVLGMVLRGGLALVLFGMVLGLLASLGLGRVLGGELFGVEALDPATYGVVCFVLLGAGLVACLEPAWRATRVDPLTALRHD